MSIKTFSGKWHVPNEEENEIQSFSGILRINENGALTLEFTLERDEPGKMIPGLAHNLGQINNQVPLPLIVGYAKDLTTNNDVGFSLYDLEIIGYTRSGLTHVTLEATYASTILQFKKTEGLKFQSSMMKFEGMDEWLDKNGFEFKSHDETKQYKTSVEFTQPEPIDIIKSKSEQVYFYFRASSPLFANTNRVTIDQSIFVNWENKDPKSISELVAFSECLQNFFSFISTYPARRLQHEIRLLKGKYNPKKSNGYLNLDFYYKDRAIQFSDHAKKCDFLFTYSTFGDQSKEILANWISTYENYTIAFDQYFDMKYNRNLHVTSRLTTMTSIIEIMYVKIFNKDPRNLTLKLNNLIEAKKELFNSLPVSKDNMVNQIVAVRKYFVHGTTSEHFQDENTSERSMIKFSVQLENIFRIYILSELGISDAEIKKMINRQPWKWGI
jgi:hypothetical protein